MKKNRKDVETYRFNGNPFLHARSIRSVAIADLESLIGSWDAKLADPDDADDKKWTERWLNRFRTELFKKRRALSLKAGEKAKSTSRRRGFPSPKAPDV